MTSLLYVILVICLIVLLLRLFGVFVGSIIAWGSPLGLIILILIVLALMGKL